MLDASATPPEASPDDSPRGLDPRARTAWTVTSAGLTALAGAALAVIAVVAGLPPLVVAAVSVAGAVGVVAAAVGARLRWAAYRYRVGAEALEITHGVVVRTLSVVPYHRIQQIDVRRGPVERRLGLATLVLRSAAATTDAAVPGLAEADATALRTLLLERAGAGDAV